MEHWAVADTRLKLLKKISPNGKLLGVDWDKERLRLKIVFARGKSPEGLKLKDYKNVILINNNYANLPEILEEDKEKQTLRFHSGQAD